MRDVSSEIGLIKSCFSNCTVGGTQINVELLNNLFYTIEQQKKQLATKNKSSLPSISDIKAMREKTGLTLRELALVTNVSHSTICRIENNSKCEYENFRKVYEYLFNCL